MVSTRFVPNIWMNSLIKIAFVFLLSVWNKERDLSWLISRNIWFCTRKPVHSTFHLINRYFFTIFVKINVRFYILNISINTFIPMSLVRFIVHWPKFDTIIMLMSVDAEPNRIFYAYKTRKQQLKQTVTRNVFSMYYGSRFWTGNL